MAELAALLAAKVQLDPALDLLADTFVKTRPARNRNRINRGLGGVDASTQFRLSSNVAWRLRDAADHVILTMPGGDIHYAPAVAGGVRRALNGNAFTLADLPAEGGVMLLGDLIDYGVVEPA